MKQPHCDVNWNNPFFCDRKPSRVVEINGALRYFCDIHLHVADQVECEAIWGAG